MDVKVGDKNEEALVLKNSIFSFGNQKALENN